MDEPLNILVLSCGTRNKIIQYFKKEIGENGQVMATDSSELAPALYDADKYFIVPRMTEPGYLDEILKICKENKIKGILSLIDPELSLLSKYKQEFLDIGTTPIVSDYNLVELCFDKFKFNEFLGENNFNTIKSYISKEKFYEDLSDDKIKYPVFVKPVQGSASINISKVSSNDDIDSLFHRYDNLMIQEYMGGIEYGADTYIDMVTGEITAIFIKQKLKMRAGETDKSVSVKNEELFSLIQKFVNIAGFRGVIDIDIFEVDGKFLISEVNPRFGGGYPHAYEAGVNIPKMIINNLRNIENDRVIGQYAENLYMMKYSEIKILNGLKD